MDLTATQPSLRNSKFIKRTFSEYLEAADAMVELTNYIENQVKRFTYYIKSDIIAKVTF